MCHTKRLFYARLKAIKKWKKGFILPDNLSQKDIDIFSTAFNMGYKVGKEHALNPKTPQPNEQNKENTWKFATPNGNITQSEGDAHIG